MAEDGRDKFMILQEILKELHYWYVHLNLFKQTLVMLTIMIFVLYPYVTVLTTPFVTYDKDKTEKLVREEILRHETRKH